MMKSPASGNDSSSAYIPGLDGVRALAAFVVMGFHLILPGFSYGWIGVPCFFALSGFLITGILLDRREEPRYFRNFYVRRALRIFPIYYLALLATTISALTVFRNWAHSDYPYFYLYLQNFRIAATDFQPAFPGFMNHTWSLAVEEQFYLFWPFAVYVLNRRSLTALCFGLISLAALYRAWAAIKLGAWTQVFFPLPANLDTLAAGALLAIAARNDRSIKLVKRGLRPALPLSGVGCLLTGLSLGPWRPEFLLTVGGAILLGLLCLFFVSCIAWVVLVDRENALLSAGWLRYSGKISYGLYLYHPLVYFFVELLAGRIPSLQRALGDSGMIGLKITLTFLIAGVSFQLIEKPILDWKEHWSRKQRKDIVLASDSMAAAVKP